MASVMDCSKEDPARAHRIILSGKTAKTQLHMPLKAKSKSSASVTQGVTAWHLQTYPCSSLHNVRVAIRIRNIASTPLNSPARSLKEAKIEVEVSAISFRES